jgi:hypothetical protein
MKLVLLLLFVAATVIKLPDGKLGQTYKATIPGSYTACSYDATGKTNPAMQRGLPPGFAVSSVGEVTGRATRAGFFESAVNCHEGSLKVRIHITP